jgi:DNA-binding PadR family transcriptional regulator
MAESDPFTSILMRDGLFFDDFVRLHILYLAFKKPVCGVVVVAELDRLGYRLHPGKVYPVLHALEQAGYLAGRSVMVCGKRRKCYEATEQGRQVMEVARARLHELAGELLRQMPDLRKGRFGKQSKKCLEDSCDSGESDLQ